MKATDRIYTIRIDRVSNGFSVNVFQVLSDIVLDTDAVFTDIKTMLEDVQQQIDAFESVINQILSSESNES